MTTITWKIVAIDYDTKAGVKVPTVAHWTCLGEDGEGNTGRSYGTRAVTQGSAKAFKGWNNITEAEALEWLMTDMSVATMDVDGEGKDSQSEKEMIEASVNAQIAEKSKPTRGTGLPWESQEVAVMPAPKPKPKTKPKPKAKATNDAGC
jgi:hypothetical protein